MKNAGTMEPFYRKLLQRQLLQRQRTNTSFSLRSYAKLLELQPATLSAVLKGKRHLPGKYGPRVAQKLRLEPITKHRFLKSLSLADGRKKGELENLSEPLLLRDETHHQIIAEWEHYAILSLIESRSFVSDPAFIARRLGIPVQRASICLENLREAQLTYVDETGRIQRTQADVRTTEDVLSTALRASHLDSLALGKEKIELPLDQRDFSSGTIVMPADKIPQAKRMIREFRRAFYDLMEDNDGEDVFHMSIQFFPLTQLEPKP